ncbi:MAG: carbonic anhydrase [Sphingomonadales bacterium]|nr:carbonic anhydrase [Sphingomonadales bacterium]
MTEFVELLAGYRRFRDTGWREQRARWDELKDGQAPKTMIMACSDSRVDPAQIFDTNPGEMFVVRNVANLVPPFEQGGGRHGVSAALEFAVTQLKVADIVVMGHGACGGCEAAFTGSFAGAAEGSGGFIAHWVDMLDDAVARVREEHGSEKSRDALRAVEHEAVRVSLANLRSFPFVREAEANGRLELHGAWFAISDGILHRLDDKSGEFEAEAIE